MSKHIEYVRRIASLKRLNLSRNGNPRFEITFTDGFVAKTQVDAMVAYGIENPEYRDRPLLVKATPSGLVWGLTPCRYATEDECEEQLSGQRDDLLVDWKGDLVVVL